MTKYEDIRKKIKIYLDEYGPLNKLQLAELMELDDTRWISENVETLLDIDEIIKIKYDNRLVYYTLAGQAHRIQELDKRIEQEIQETIRTIGPEKANPIAKQIAELHDEPISQHFVYRKLSKMLENETITSEWNGQSHIYYTNGQHDEAVKMANMRQKKKRNRKLKRLYISYIKKMKNEYGLSDTDTQILMDVLDDFRTFSNIDYHTNLDDLIFISLDIYVRKKIYEMYKKDTDFEFMKRWIKISELLTEKRHNIYKGKSRKTYNTVLRKILADRNFCKKSDISGILNSPYFELQIQYILSVFHFQENIEKNIKRIIHKCRRAGMMTGGKSIRGIIGGAVYLYCKKTNIQITQREVAKILDVTTVTIRRRKDEMQNYIDQNSEILDLDEDDIFENKIHYTSIQKTHKAKKVNMPPNRKFKVIAKHISAKTPITADDIEKILDRGFGVESKFGKPKFEVRRMRTDK